MPPCPTCQGTGSAPRNAIWQILDHPGTTSTSHPTTSRKAGTTPRKGSQRLRVLEVLLDHGPLTAYAVSEQVGSSPNQVAARLLELRKDGFVSLRMVDGQIETRATTVGNTGRVHEITNAGVAAVQAVEQMEVA